jgi:hypothetical protein
MNSNLHSNDFLLLQHIGSLKAHLVECRSVWSWPMRARCVAEQVFELTAPRLFTTIAVAGVVLSVTLAVTSHWA